LAVASGHNYFGCLACRLREASNSSNLCHNSALPGSVMETAPTPTVNSRA